MTNDDKWLDCGLDLKKKKNSRKIRRDLGVCATTILHISHRFLAKKCKI